MVASPSSQASPIFADEAGQSKVGVPPPPAVALIVSKKSQTAGEPKSFKV